MTPTPTAASLRAVAAHYILYLLLQFQTEYVCVSVRMSGIGNERGLDGKHVHPSVTQLSLVTGAII